MMNPHIHDDSTSDKSLRRCIVMDMSRYIRLFVSVVAFIKKKRMSYHFSEALRLYPPASTIMRECTKAYTLEDGKS